MVADGGCFGEGIAHRIYYEQSGVGLTILNFPRQSGGLRVGVLGLGAGTLAVYGQSGDVYRFYEINPVVIDLARGRGGYFSFLSDSKAKIEIVQGDARISWNRKPPMGFFKNMMSLSWIPLAVIPSRCI